MSIFDGIPDRETNPPENAALERYLESNQYKTDLSIAVDEWIANNDSEAETLFTDYLVGYNLTLLLNGEENQIIESAREQTRNWIAEEHCSDIVQNKFLGVE